VGPGPSWRGGLQGEPLTNPTHPHSERPFSDASLIRYEFYLGRAGAAAHLFCLRNVTPEL
jgi:hypothetical protein